MNIHTYHLLDVVSSRRRTLTLTRALSNFAASYHFPTGLSVRTAVCHCCSNIVRRRPINNRTPTPEEMDFYLPILLEEIALVDPDVIVTLGTVPAGVAVVVEARSELVWM